MKQFLIQASCLFSCIWMLSGCASGPDYEIEKRIFVDQASLSLFVGDNTKLTASPTTESFQWESLNTSVVTVSANGDVQATGAGETVIRVRNGDIIRNIPVSVVVKIPIAQISVSETSLELYTGETATLTTKYLPENYNEKGPFAISWQSSNPSVATVTEGKVVAIMAGSATVTATLIQNQSVKTTISVTVLPPPTMDISKFSSSGNFRYSKVTFEKGGEITIIGINAAAIAAAYNRDFFQYVNGKLIFIGESGEWEVYYSSTHNYFWVFRGSDVAPACYWVIGSDMCVPPAWYSDIASNWNFADIWRLGYMKRLDSGKYQASIYLNSGFDIQIYSNREWGGVVSQQTLTGDHTGIVVHGNGSDMVQSDGFVPGYFRLTFDATTNTLNFERIN